MLGKILNRLLRTWIPIKYRMMRFVYNLRPGIYLGKGVRISGSSLRVKPGGEIRIGSNTVVEDTLIDASDRKISIGAHCSLFSSNLRVKFGGEISIGDHTELLEGSIIQTYGGHITIGDHCSINAHTVIYGHGNTTIGSDVLIAGHCMIIPSNHVIDDVDNSIRAQGNVSKGISIKDNVWIGHGCSILDGITIKEGCVIGAGSVVKESTEQNGIYVGVPARLKKLRK